MHWIRRFTSKPAPLLFTGLLLAAPLLVASVAEDGARAADRVEVFLPTPPASAPLPQPFPKSRSEKSEVSAARESAKPSELNGLGKGRRAELRKHQDPALASRPVNAECRLAFCTEYTKPDSLRIFLFGTPHNHRSPPA